MTQQPTKLVAKPDLAFLADLIRQAALMATNCHALGQISSFNSAKQSAQVSINYTRLVNGNPVAYPVLVDCPVIVLGGGAGHLTFPIAAGDSCLVLFNDVNMTTWIATGNTGAQPANGRLHSFSDAIVLVGISAFPQALSGYFADGVELYNEDTSIQLSDKVRIENAATDIKTVLESLNSLMNTFFTATGSATLAPQIAVAATTANVALASWKTQMESLFT